jgi:hypothetical protein
MALTLVMADCFSACAAAVLRLAFIEKNKKHLDHFWVNAIYLCSLYDPSLRYYFSAVAPLFSLTSLSYVTAPYRTTLPSPSGPFPPPAVDFHPHLPPLPCLLRLPQVLRSFTHLLLIYLPFRQFLHGYPYTTVYPTRQIRSSPQPN